MLAFLTRDQPGSRAGVAPFTVLPTPHVPGTAVATIPNDAPTDIQAGEPRPTEAQRDPAHRQTSTPSAGMLVGGTIDGVLAPGTSAPINVTITNRRASAQTLSELDVRISDVRAPRADAGHPCTASDFTVAQLAGSPGISIAPGATRSLAESGVARSRWPQVRMRNRSSNQDGCQRATLTLSFRIDASGEHA